MHMWLTTESGRLLKKTKTQRLTDISGLKEQVEPIKFTILGFVAVLLSQGLRFRSSLSLLWQRPRYDVEPDCYEEDYDPEEMAICDAVFDTDGIECCRKCGDDCSEARLQSERQRIERAEALGRRRYVVDGELYRSFTPISYWTASDDLILTESHGNRAAEYLVEKE